MSLRVLHVVPTYLPATRYGGPIYSVHGLCRGLAALGHDVSVFTTNVDGESDSAVPLDTLVDLDGVKVRYFRSASLRRVYYAPTMQRRVAQVIGGFDLVHLHSVFLWPTSMVARAALEHRVPYVVSPRGMLVADLIARKNRLIKTAWLALIESKTLAHAGAVHFTSERELQDARALPLPLPAHWLLPNGVELPEPSDDAPCSPRMRALLAQGPYGLILGRVHWKKGIDRALHALRGNNVRLVVAGDDEGGQRAQLQRLAHALGVEARVHFEPPVHGDDKWVLLKGARFVVVPSLHENFGNVVLEAMAAGRPIILTEAVGASALVREAEAGVVVDPEPQALGRVMDALWGQPERCRSLGEAGARFARRLSWTQVARKMAERYATLVLRQDQARQDRAAPRAS